ncbi:MAG: Holliday junction endonuclease, partial [Phycisphaerae bacterium]|nr:Holliday junction endonuclease [Phycisphaerae bacterium]
AIVEKVHSRPGNSARSMFGFGTGYGLLLGILAAFAIPKELVMPQRWQIAMLAGENKSDTKAASRRVAKRLFPGVNFFATSRSVIESHGMTDAALLAEYGRRMRL